MKSTTPKRDAIDNEVVFRRKNENVQKGMAQVRKLAKEDDQAEFIISSTSPLHFYCECSDENCRQRIVIEPQRYNQIHDDRKWFIVLPGHVSEDIERVVDKTATYWIVEKHQTPPTGATTLKSTDINND